MELTSGSVDLQTAIWQELDVPSPFVNSMVMPRAKRYKIGEIGLAALLPLVDVVSLAPIDGGGTSDPSTGGVYGFDRRPLAVRSDAALASDVYRYSSTIKDNSPERCVAS